MYFTFYFEYKNKIMSKLFVFTLLVLSIVVVLISGQSVKADFANSLLSKKLREKQAFDCGKSFFGNQSISEVMFTHSNVLCPDGTLKRHLFISKSNNTTTKISWDSVRLQFEKYLNRNARSSRLLPWYFELLRGMFYTMKKCLGQVDCYKKLVLRGMDRVIEMKSLKIGDGIFLVEQEESESTLPRESDNEPFWMAFSRRIVRVLETHALRVRLGVMKENISEARIGHHGYKHAFPLMVGSFMLLAAFLVPMGFQFLAVVGGKALILSQIALVMAMGSSLQRMFGFGSQKQGVGGVVQHEYYVRDDLHPWHRQGTEGKQTNYPQEQELPSYPQQQLTQQQLQGLMNYH